MELRIDDARPRTAAVITALAPIVVDGREFPLRPLVGADRELLNRGFQALSPRSRYLRFGAAKPRLSPRELSYLTEVDHHRHEALLVLTPDRQRMVAIGRYVTSPYEPSTADVAVTVGDEWQGRGIGSQLVARLLLRARQEGVQRLTATALAENTRSVKMLLAAGFRVVDRQWGTLELSLPLERRLTAGGG